MCETISFLAYFKASRFLEPSLYARNKMKTYNAMMSIILLLGPAEGFKLCKSMGMDIYTYLSHNKYFFSPSVLIMTLAAMYGHGPYIWQFQVVQASGTPGITVKPSQNFALYSLAEVYLH